MELHGATLLLFPPAHHAAAAAASAAPAQGIERHFVAAQRLTHSPVPDAKTQPFHEALATAQAKTVSRAAPVPSRPDNDNVPIEDLAGAKNLTDQEKLHIASRKFEAVLLRQILAEAQKPVIQSSFTDNSAAAGIYRDLVTTQLADDISGSGAIGLAQMLERQLTPPKPVSKPVSSPTHE